MMFHLNLICCHLLNLLPFPLQELVAEWRRNEISLSSMNFTEYVNAATFPIQISYMGISLGKGNAASFTHLVNAIQQPVYPFFHNALYILFLLTCRSLNSDGKRIFRCSSVTSALLITQSYFCSHFIQVATLLVFHTSSWSERNM